MSTVAVISHLWLGHIPTYHRLLVERLTLAGHRVLSLAPCSAEEFTGSGARGLLTHAQFGASPAEMTAMAQSAMRKPLGRRLLDATGASKVVRATGLPAVFRAARLWRRTTQAVEKLERAGGVPADLVVLVYPESGYDADLLLAGIVPYLLPREWVGIWNGPAMLRGDGRKQAGRIFRARNCRAVLVPDPWLRDRLREWDARWRAVAMPEIADLSPPAAGHPLAQQIKAAAAGRSIVALLGNIARRKGIFTLLEMAVRAHQGASPLFFVAAGDFSRNSCGDDYEAISAACAVAPGNFLLLPERVPDGPAFNALVVASDILFAAYLDFPFQSNLLTKAAAFGRPVVVSHGYVMERRTVDYGLGLAVPQADAGAALAAVETLLDATAVDQSTRRGEYLRENSLEALDQLLAELLGTPFR